MGLIEDRSAYFTFWVVCAMLVSVVFLIVTRLARCSLPSAGVFIVCGSALLGLLGTDVVAHRLDVPLKHQTRLMESHLVLHMIPLVLSIALLCTWPQAVGDPTKWRSVLVSLVCLLVLFIAYLSWPLKTGERFADKLRAVYNVQRPWEYCAVGAGIVTATSLLLVAHGANIKCKK